MQSSTGARIGSVVRRLRRSRQPPLTQRRLAELASVAPGTIAFLETGRVRNPSPAVTDALARALGFTDTTALLREGREILTSGEVSEPLPDDPQGEDLVPRLAALAGELAALKESVLALRQEQGELWQAFFQHVAERRGTRSDRVVPSSGPASDSGDAQAGLGGPWVRIEDAAMEPWLSAGDAAVYEPGARARTGDPVVVGLQEADTSAERVLVRFYFPRRGRVELRALRGDPEVRSADALVLYGVVRKRLLPMPGWQEAAHGGGAGPHSGVGDDARAERDRVG